MSSTSTAAQSSKSANLPHDARLIALLLAAKGIEDSDERVLHQLMDFAHRYTSEIVSDAAAFAEHAGRAGKLEVSDVELAVRTRSAWEFEEAAPKDYLLPIAKQLNSQPLPIFSETLSHVRLPPREHMLGNANFRLVPNLPPDRAVDGLVWDKDEEDSEEDDESEKEDDNERIQQIGASDLEDDEDEDEDGEEGGDGYVAMDDVGGVNGRNDDDAEPAAKRPKLEDDDYDAA